MNNLLELCTCGCAKQVHELAHGKCYNQTCANAPCDKFEGTGKLHTSAFCWHCDRLVEDCICDPDHDVYYD